MIINVVIAVVIITVSGPGDDDGNRFRVRGSQSEQSGSDQQKEEEFFHKMSLSGSLNTDGVSLTFRAWSCYLVHGLNLACLKLPPCWSRSPILSLRDYWCFKVLHRFFIKPDSNAIS